MQEYRSSFSDSELAERHARRAQARRKKQRIRRRRLFFQFLPMIAVVGVLGVLLSAFTSREKEDTAPPILESVSTAIAPEISAISDKMPELDIPYSASARMVSDCRSMTTAYWLSISEERCSVLALAEAE